MKLNGSLTDEAILREVGHRLVQLRIDLSWTQAELAERSGIGKRTVERLENGESVQAVGVIRVLRAFGLLETLDSLVPEASLHPMELLKKHTKPRRRASSSRTKKEDGSAWVWEDEK
ncbi:MAG: helix-turn-helix domain-containing protein [Treponemataceae bacterium]